MTDFDRNLMHAKAWLHASRKAPVFAKGVHRWNALTCASDYVALALGEANRMRDRKRAALCLRILNWIRADIARTV